MAEYHLHLPLSELDVTKLAVGDVVYLHGNITVTGGAPAHKRITQYLDEGRAMPMDMDSTFIQLPHMIEETPNGAIIHYVNPTTSMRFDAYMPRLIKGLGLRMVGGKGGLGPETVLAMKEAGCVYVSLLGGGSPILSACIKALVQMEWRDFTSHFRLSKLRVESFGPLTVGIDAHGHSVYDQLQVQGRARLPEILARLAERRAEERSEGNV